MTFKLKLTLPKIQPQGGSSGGGPLGTGLQFFCLQPESAVDNARRVCVWIPGLQPTDSVAWAVTNTFSGVTGAPFYENVNNLDSTDPCLIVYSGSAGDTGSITVTATVNGTALNPLTINFPADCP